MSVQLTEPYFTQTQAWSDFFVDANTSDHGVFEIDVDGYKTYIYIYPWFLGQKFLYIPSGPILKEYNQENIDKFASELKKFALILKVTFIKFDLSPKMVEFLKENGSDDQIASLKHTLSPHFNNILKSRKRLMYLSTILLDSKSLNISEDEITTETLPLFYEQNSEFFGKINSGHRAKTKKSLNQGWQITTDKTEDNFDYFWQIYQQTATRQSFFTHKRDYFYRLFQTDDSRLIILSKESGKPEAVWFGYSDKNSLIYLYGGNTSTSMNNFGQYYIHLAALMMAKKENKEYYDLGGYDSKEGYGVFKERYKGQIIDFGGPYDLVLQNSKYQATEAAIKTIKTFKNIGKKRKT
jgi:lipid II:glycine glycyltransferase (peptidoglycan interpeptide bridge formation enzyme)